MSGLVKIISVYKTDNARVLYYVKAASPSCAVNALRDLGFNIDRNPVQSEYDCSGEWFSLGVNLKRVAWCRSIKCYIVPVNFLCDL